MLSYKITVASGLVLRVVISVFWDPIWVRCVFEEGGGDEVGAHHKNQLNVLPFFVKTSILHIIAPSLRGCTSSLSKHASQEVH